MARSFELDSPRGTAGLPEGLIAGARSPRSPRGDAGDRSLPSWRDPTEAMSADTYRSILGAQGRVGAQSFARHGPEDDYTQEQLYVRQDMAKNKVVWVGDFYKDLWYYLININPILASCYSHPLHPISRVERYLVYALCVLFVSNITASLALSLECEPCGFDMNTYTCDVDTKDLAPLNCTENFKVRLVHIDNAIEFQARTLPLFCCRSLNFGALWFWKTFHHVGGTLYSLLANMIFCIVCFQLMMCPCVQQLSMRSRQIGERVGIIVFVFVAMFTVFFSMEILGDVFRVRRLTTMAVVFFSTKLMSWLGASIFNVSLFCLLFWVQTPKPEGSHWRWLDASEDRQLVDTRPGWVQAVNARFHVLASEHQQWVGCAHRARASSTTESSGTSLQDMSGN